ncbi:MAG: histidinol dehydrogenase [Pseudobdellovibrionaceae bacterium]
MAINIVNWNPLNTAEKRNLLQRAKVTSQQNQSVVVQQILDDVRANGDSAVLQYTKKFDAVDLKTSKVDFGDAEAAWQRLPLDLKEALKTAANNIRLFHQKQIQDSNYTLSTTDGVTCSRKKIPLKTVGLYIPGGSAPLFSTLLMTAIPAQLAKVENIVICSPPEKSGSIHDFILGACFLLNIKNIFAVGGVQAIGALAYGTETIPAVDKIFGPGNSWVTAAKTFVAQNTPGLSIDMPAGPSEVLVIADKNAKPLWLAWDLLSQLEHGPDSQAILICNQLSILEQTRTEILNIIESSKRQSILKDSVQNLRLILVENIDTALQISNDYAPEHLILNLKEADQYLDKIQNAGSVFVGEFSPESVGDYASGTNHVLPTAGYAKSYSGLNVDSFLKSITFQTLSAQGLLNLATTVETMARYEGLEAHQMAVQARRLDIEGGR